MEDKISIIIEQWKTCVEMADSISQRRDTFNNIFITLNTAVLSVIILNKDVDSVCMSVLGIINLIFWLIIVLNFKRLNKAKYKVISEIEKKLPIKAFTNEWKYAIGENHYIRNTTIEIILITAFLIIYIYVIVMKIFVIS